MFLVGKEIPEEIRTLPDRFLKTPFGQMMRPQIDSALRGVTQAPVIEKPPPAQSSRNPAVANTPANAGLNESSVPPQRMNGDTSLYDAPKIPTGVVHNVTSLQQVKNLLESAKSTCAVIFFTSATCPPCKMVYPAYDELAQVAGSKAVLIKVDISQAHEVAQKYQIRATPTFKSFSRGQEQDTWQGANERQLRSTVQTLLDVTYPAHPHTKLRVSNFQVDKQPVLFKKIPPLDKLAAKVGSAAQSPPLSSLLAFNKTRFASDEPVASTALPSDLSSLPSFIAEKLPTIPRESQFALVDLIRVSFIDPRISGFFAAEDPASVTLLTLLQETSQALSDGDTVPYGLHLCTLQLLCNLFTTPLYASHCFNNASELHDTIISITTSSLLSSNSTITYTAAALAFNLVVSLHNNRFYLQQNPDSTPPNTTELESDSRVSITASLLEALDKFRETTATTNGTNGTTSSKPPASTTPPKDVLQALLLAIGMLAYGAETDGETFELCEAMDVKETIEEIGQRKDFKGMGVLKDVLAML